ncbi:hypothetical protein CMV_016415 [Castanea mollissima]|uniref:DUF4218 domain-containing protein n=1 Tax=Castanea mollissima TaxID=60419 RepID=A0A8J4QZQ4_9ROSI|nr:hypothetical protein CMV_016415 [Castanea mollissima]
MYPVERYLSRLKSYVRNKACPEGCIAEGCDEITPFRTVHRNHLKELHPNVANDVIEKQHMERFCHWFKYHVLSMDVDERKKLPEKVIWLARYPDNEVKRDVEGTIYETPLFVERELVEDDNIDDEEFIDDVYESNDESTDDENEDGEDLNDGSNDELTDDES